MKTRLLLFLACFLTAAGTTWAVAEDAVTAEQEGPVSAQESEEEQEIEKEEEDRFRLLPIPIFITEPAVGEGLGVALALFHPVKTGKSDDTRVATLGSMAEYSSPRKAPPVVTGVAGAYTNSKSWFGGIGHTNNWRDDSIRYTGLLAAAKINSSIYVLGLPVDFSMEATMVFQDMKFRVAESDFMLGAAISYMDAENKFGFGLPEIPEDDRFSSDLKNVGLALKAAYETRDNTMNPRTGQLVELNLWRYDDAIGGDYNYWSGKLKALSFHTFAEKFTLGLRLDVSGVDGRAPFFAIPFVKLRGVPALRYQNKVAGAAEMEVRYLIGPRWEVSLFGGVGFASDDYPLFENPDSIYNFGFGGRFNIFEAHDVWVGLDIARGPEDWNYYIQVGHPW
ncbi:hypothetical protein ACFL0N_00570 [Pseudomonadota bacterium]